MRNTPIMYYVRMRISASACVFMLVNKQKVPNTTLTIFLAS